MSYSANPPRLPQSLDEDVKNALTLMWQDLIRPFNKAGMIPLAINDTIGNQGNYPPKNYPNGALYFANDTTHLYVDDYSSGTPTWVKVT